LKHIGSVEGEKKHI